jgi:hypothetical protein
MTLIIQKHWKRKFDMQNTTFVMENTPVMVEI